MSKLEKFAEQIFDEHFGDKAEYNIVDAEGSENRQKSYKLNPFRKYFSELRKYVILNIKDAITRAIPETNYEDYMKNDFDYEVNLLNELTPFISNKISTDILNEYQSNDYFNSQNVSDIYFYQIPDDVVEDVINIKNKKEENIIYANDYKIKMEEDYIDLIENPDDYVLDWNEYKYIEDGDYLELTHLINLNIEFIKGKKVKGYVNINAYLKRDKESGYTLTIFEMSARPERKGFGSLAMKILSEQLNESHITIDVVDITDETKDFWEKMYNLGYITTYI